MICALCKTECIGDYVKTPEGLVYDIDCIKRYYIGRKTNKEINKIINDMKIEYYCYNVKKKLETIKNKNKQGEN